MDFAAMMALAFAVDVAVGWPQWLFLRIGHPVVWIGSLITWLERHLNKGRRWRRRIAGGMVTALVVAVAALPLFIIPNNWWLMGIIAWPLIAIRAMYAHVVAVARPLGQGQMAEARHAVSMIVGRDPEQLDKAGIARAALESLAENTSDGIIAPLFWGVVAGLPGIAAYKAINTMDSMIGHRNARYEDFGKVAARLDDLVNIIPARLTGVLFALCSARPFRALVVMWRNAGKHRSPNAGWPEAAMAGALRFRLSGPRRYGDHIADEPWLNPEDPDPMPQDIDRALALYRRVMLLCFGLLLGLAYVQWGVR